MRDPMKDRHPHEEVLRLQNEWPLTPEDSLLWDLQDQEDNLKFLT